MQLLSPGERIKDKPRWRNWRDVIEDSSKKLSQCIALQLLWLQRSSLTRSSCCHCVRMRVYRIHDALNTYILCRLFGWLPSPRDLLFRISLLLLFGILAVSFTPAEKKYTLPISFPQSCLLFVLSIGHLLANKRIACLRNLCGTFGHCRERDYHRMFPSMMLQNNSRSIK